MDPQSPSEWLSLVRQHEVAAHRLADDRLAAAQAYFHVGFAAECALKAYIMWSERLNSWPDKGSRPELYTHDLRKLVEIARIELRTRDPIGPSWRWCSSGTEGRVTIQARCRERWLGL